VRRIDGLNGATIKAGLLCSLNPQTELAKVDHPASIVIHDIKIEGISIT
jgi:hypothetical protein